MSKIGSSQSGVHKSMSLALLVALFFCAFIITLQVYSAGTLITPPTFPLPSTLSTTTITLSVSVSPTTATIDSGQSITLTATPSGGVGSVTYQWYSNSACSTSISGATSSTYAASPTSTTTYCVKATSGTTATATSVITVNPALVAGAITAPSSPPGVVSGYPITLTANPSGGTPPYFYQWYSGSSCGTTIAGATSSTYTVTPTATTGQATTDYCYKVTDSAHVPEAVTSAAEPLVAGANDGQLMMDLGQSITLTATTTGGTAPYSYVWYDDDDCSQVIPGSPTGYGTSNVYVETPASTLVVCIKSTASGSNPLVSYAGIELIVNPALVAGPISPASPTIVTGHSQVLTSDASGGTTPYFYKWYSGASSTCTSDAVISGATSSTYTASPTTSTYYCYEVIDSSQAVNAIANSPTDLVTVNPALSVTVLPTTATIDNGQSITLTATAAGGVPSYTYQWYSNSACTTSITGATSSTYAASPSATTTYCVKATDSESPAATATATSVITVNPALTAGAVTPAGPSIIAGGSQLLTANPSGGTTPYSYQWYVGGSLTCSSDTAIAGATSSTYLASPGTSLYYCYKVTDSAHSPESASSIGDLVTVIPVLSVAVSPTAATIDNGQSITITATPSGGTGTYTYQWYSNSACTTSISGATSTTYTPSPASTTTYCVKATSGTQTANAISAITVNPALTAGAVTPASPAIVIGGSQTLTANPSGGTTPYSYQWYSGASATCTSDSAISGATSSTYLASPTSSTYYCYTVTDSAHTPESATSGTDLVTVYPLLSLSVAPTAATIDNGQSITLTATQSGGTGAYTDQWYSNSACTTSIGGATSSTYAASPASTTTYCIKATSGTQTANAISAITVNPALTAGAVTPASPTIVSGHSITLTSNPSGGTTPYTYQWYSGSSSTCTSDSAIAGATAATYSAGPTSSTYYCYKVTDSAHTPESATSVTDHVTVNPVLSVAVAPTRATLDDGQSVTLTATATGGITPYTYQWYIFSGNSCATSISGATSNTYVASPTSTTTYCIEVVDSESPVAEVSAVSTITVNPALAAGPITPASPSISSGGSQLLTANPSGGTTPYTYQWYSGVSSTCTSDSAIAGATSNTFLASPVADTYYCYQVTDSADTPESANSLTDLVSVISVSSVTIAVTSPGAPDCSSSACVVGNIGTPYITMQATCQGMDTCQIYEYGSQVTCPTGSPTCLSYACSSNICTYTTNVLPVGQYQFYGYDSSASLLSTVPATITVQSGSTFSGYFEGSLYSLEYVAYNSITKTDSNTIALNPMYSSITDFQTTNTLYSCLDGDSLDVWNAPFVYPGFFVANAPNPTGCNSITLLFVPPPFTYNGVFVGTTYQLTPIQPPAGGVPNLPDAIMINNAPYTTSLSMMDFQTLDPTYYCLAGTDLDVWSAQNEYPGVYIAVSPTGACTQGTFTFNYGPIIDSYQLGTEYPYVIPGAYDPLTFNVVFNGGPCTGSTFCGYSVELSNNIYSCPPLGDIPACYPNQNTINGCIISVDVGSFPNPHGDYLTPAPLQTYTPGNVFPGGVGYPAQYGLCYDVFDQYQSDTQPPTHYYTPTPVNTFYILPSDYPMANVPTMAFGSFGNPVSIIQQGQTVNLVVTTNSPVTGNFYVEFAGPLGVPSGYCTVPGAGTGGAPNMPLCPTTLNSMTTPDCALYSSSTPAGSGTTLQIPVNTAQLSPGSYTFCAYSGWPAISGVSLPTNEFAIESLDVAACSGCSTTQTNIFNSANVLSIACNGYTFANEIILILALALMVLGAMLYIILGTVPGQFRGDYQGYALGLMLAGVVGLVITTVSIWLLLTATGTSLAQIFSQSCFLGTP